MILYLHIKWYERIQRKGGTVLKTKKMFIVLLVVLILVSSVTGCGSKKASGKKVGVTTSDDIWAPYEETLFISTVLPENAGIQWRDGDEYDDNPWYREYKERFNIQVVNAWVSNDYSTKLNLTIADGNIPDVFVVNSEQLKQLHEAGLIWDISEVFETYASDTLKSYMEQEVDTFETAKIDGKLYGVPQLSYGIIDQPNQIWIRKDWMDQLEYEAPETMDDLVDIAKGFQKKFGGYAITEDQNLTSMYILAPAWGAYPGIWVEQSDGSIGYGTVQPEMKEIVKTFAEWYKEGLINPEFTIADQTKMLQAVINGEVGINPFPQWWGYQPGPSVITNLGPEAIFEPYAIPSATGEEVKASISFANYGYIVVSKQCQNPEAAMKLLNFYTYMMSDASEKESQELINSLYNDAYSNIPYALRVINPMTDYNLYTEVSAAMEKGLNEDVSYLGSGAVKYNNSVQWAKNKTPEAVGDYLQMGGEKTAYGIAKQMLDDNRIVKDKIWGRPTETILSAGSTLDDMLKEGFTKIIVGEEPIEYFDTLIENWKKAGGEKATNEVNEAVKE